MTGVQVIRAGEMSGDTAQTSGMVVVIARSTQEAIVVNVDSL